MPTEMGPSWTCSYGYHLNSSSPNAEVLTDSST
jgi:hypothetical protein